MNNWEIRRSAASPGVSLSVVEAETGAVVALMKSCGGRKEVNARIAGAAPQAVAALKALADIVRDVRDAGPMGADWQSDELRDAIAIADVIDAQVSSRP